MAMAIRDDTPELALSRGEVVFTALCLLFTLVAACFLSVDIGRRVARAIRDPLVLAEYTVLIFIILTLLYGSLVYQVSRLAYVCRTRAHRPAADCELDDFMENAPQVTVLIPSYQEEPAVIRQTLLSAALQGYPDLRVVLLIDDPPVSTPGPVGVTLAAARELPDQIGSLLAPVCRWLETEDVEFRHRVASAEYSPARETSRLAELHRQLAAWFRDTSRTEPIADHTGRLFRTAVLDSQAKRHDARAERYAQSQRGAGAVITAEELAQEYDRLTRVFHVELSSFERKGYVNLSHEPNKAMNLNSYLGLMGHRYRDEPRADGIHLERADSEGDATMVIPDTDLVVSLDADSIMRPDYVVRLAHLMARPGNERIAVAQTPYCAVPNASSLVERIAGATTDVQYVIHQGFTGCAATYWVGANAMLRKAALDEIAVTSEERGFPVARYVQDRTVIEDTESTIDLLERGWSLHNEPQRLVYSATPADFGSLLIQRRRWANGGLIILPKLMRYLLSGRARGGLGEAFLRVHYLASISLVTFALFVALLIPLPDTLLSWWMPAAAAPYFILYARDMHQAGHRALDIFRVYALNLLLAPVNAGGVLKSLQQVVTGNKIPFGRTPKVIGRTAAPAFYVLVEYLLVAFCINGAVLSGLQGQYMASAFAALNAVFLAYAVLAFIGPRASFEDLRLRIPSLARRATL